MTTKLLARLKWLLRSLQLSVPPLPAFLRLCTPADLDRASHVGDKIKRRLATNLNTSVTSVLPGVIVSKDLTPSKHYSDVVKSANNLISLIERSFEYKSEKYVIPSLLNALLRPHL